MHRNLIRFISALLVVCGTLWGQDTPGAPASRPTAAAPTTPSQPATPNANSKRPTPPHKFWDTENICLFAGVGGARMLDYASTRHMRDQGDHEVLLTNAIVDNRPLFVGIELAGTAASIGVSYLFHRTGHHQLERWTSIVHIGVGVTGSIHNYLLKPAQTVVLQPTVVPEASPNAR